MTDRLTLEREAEIRQRTEKANLGRWEDDGGRVVDADDTPTGQTYDHADAAFIAGARQDTPALLAEIDRLRAVLQGIADRWEDCQTMDKRGYSDHYSGYEMCREAREALGLTETPTDG